MDTTLVTVGLFFVGLMFAWLKLDLHRIETKFDGHVVAHGIVTHAEGGKHGTRT